VVKLQICLAFKSRNCRENDQKNIIILLFRVMGLGPINWRFTFVKKKFSDQFQLKVIFIIFSPETIQCTIINKNSIALQKCYKIENWLFFVLILEVFFCKYRDQIQFWDITI